MSSVILEDEARFQWIYQGRIPQDLTYADCTQTMPQQPLPERIITPHTGLDAYTDAISSILTNFSQSRSLAWRILLRDTRAMYRRSLLGYAWLFLPSLATVFVWVFLNKQGLVNIDSGDVPYPLFVLTGTVLWTAFNSSVMGMQGVLQSAGGSLSKINFPHEALIMTALGQALLNSVPTMLLLFPALLLYGGNIVLSMLLFPLGFLVLLLLGAAIGLVFVPIGALYGDVGRAIQLGLRFGFFVTPVVYALPQSGTTRSLLLYNPVTAPLVTSRSWFVGGEAPLAMETIIVGVVSLLILGLATVAFKVAMPHIIERMNS